MFSFTPRNATVLLLCDVRQKSDADFDYKNKPEPGAQAILRHWPLGVEVWGKAGWDTQVARACLFEFSQTVDKAARQTARSELSKFLDCHKGQFKHIIVLQSRSKGARKVWDDHYAEASHTGTLVWDFFNPPDSLAPAKLAGGGSSPGMNGTFWETPYGTVLGLLNPQNNAVDGYVYGAFVVRWLTAIREKHPLFLPPADTSFTEAGPGMRHGLAELFRSAIAGKPIAFDLETYSTKDCITVFGLSDGKYTCSVPWEPFQPHGQSYVERGYHLGAEGTLVRRIMASARTVIGHNIVRFDLPYLARKGVVVTGKAFDTYLAHGILANQAKHGLQACVASEFAVPPWKSIHLREVLRRGMDPDDAESWTQEPPELRGYNLRDTHYNYWLGLALARDGGVSL